MAGEPGSLGVGERGRRGAFVVLVGPDGVGKTAAARALAEAYAGPTAYFHFLPPVRGAMSARPVDNPAPPPKRTDPRGFRPLGWLRLARNVARAWLSYVLTVRPALTRGTLVLGDRWIYGYMTQPLALRFFGPARLARLAVLLLPRPDLVANLTAPVGLIRNRKQELSGAQIEAELAAWAVLPVPELKTFEADVAPEVIATRILQAL